MRIASTAVVLLALTVTGARAGDGVSAVGAWARATASAAQTGAVYLTIIDTGAADKLVAVETPVASSARLHQTVKNGNVVGMRPVDALPVSNAGPVMLAPGGYHIMLMGLKEKLEKGASFPITLTFEKAGKVEAKVAVEAADAGGPSQDAGPGHDMDKMSGMKH